MYRSFVSIVLLAAAFAAFLPVRARAAASEERFPPPQFKVRKDYKIPDTHVSAARAKFWPYLDTALLAAALGAAAWLVHRKRSRRWMFILTIACVAYFGFYRQGCVCPVGSVQNVALAAFNPGYALPWMVAAFFLLPLAFTLFYGRVFCSSVCPLGAIQDLVLWKPVNVPGWVEASLGLFAYLYLGLGVLYAATGGRFIICEWDPFVAFFRFSGTANMLVLGAALLLLSMFVGRTYCRFICPYGVLLRLLSPFSRHRVTITPQECVDCRLCEESCPYGAIHRPTPIRRSGRRDQGKQLLAAMLGLLPILIGLGAFIGYFGGNLMVRAETTVKLARRIHLEETGKVQGVIDESTAFRDSGEPIASLYQRARTIQRRFAWGGAGLGAWVGLVAGLKLVGWSVRRRRTEYEADAGACLACARCFRSCPVEHQRLAREKELSLSV